ncbi:MAG: AAA family ATPase [Deltaproteobacteria bacterium]|nr:AAA family ATPase [Candidatus Anaeroferrophillus wilburensis]MBN2889246.1 AAA family ATPase [Deltaproteobacteria bacterium]
MKIAISGKGGVGKTTLAGTLARLMAAQGRKVLAIDADPDANLASAIGFTMQEASSVTPLAQMTEEIESRTGAKKGTFGGIFKLNPKVDDIPEKFSLVKENIKLLILGTIPEGGGGCYCPEGVLLKYLLRHIFLQRDESIILDMEAGLEHLGRGSTRGIDAFIVVVEPGTRSLQTARQVKKLAADLGIQQVYVVGNKIHTPEDRQFIADNLDDMIILGGMDYNPAIVEADRRDQAPYDVNPEVVAAVQGIYDNLCRHLTLTEPSPA